jgi:hypothetical protein
MTYGQCVKLLEEQRQIIAVVTDTDLIVSSPHPPDEQRLACYLTGIGLSKFELERSR